VRRDANRREERCRGKERKERSGLEYVLFKPGRRVQYSTVLQYDVVCCSALRWCAMRCVQNTHRAAGREGQQVLDVEVAYG
jgi:hypothetical protein